MFNVRINLCVDFHLPKLQLRNIAIKWLCDSGIGNWCRYAYSYVEYTRRADVQLVNIVILSCIWLSEWKVICYLVFVFFFLNWSFIVVLRNLNR